MDKTKVFKGMGNCKKSPAIGRRRFLLCVLLACGWVSIRAQTPVITYPPPAPPGNFFPLPEVLPDPPSLVSEPLSQTVAAGTFMTSLTVRANGQLLDYQWYHNGVPILGNDLPTIGWFTIGTAQAGDYQVTVSNAGGSVTSNVATIVVTSAASLVNFSARANVGPMNDVLIAGFALAYPPGTVLVGAPPGAETLLPVASFKNIIVRGAGPALSSFGIGSALATPQLTLFDSRNRQIASDSGWTNRPVVSLTAPVSVQGVDPDAQTAVGAFPFEFGSADSAMTILTSAASYTAKVAGANGSSGIALAEIYDTNPGLTIPYRLNLSNLSARGAVGAGDNVLVGGFTVAGVYETLLIRAIGPGLSPLGIADPLAQPRLTLFDSSNAPFVSNTGWSNGPSGNPSLRTADGHGGGLAGIFPATAEIMAQVGAFPLAAGSNDCAMILTLPAGSYTAQISGGGNSTGVALLEIYEIH